LAITSPLIYNKVPLKLVGFVGNVVGGLAASSKPSNIDRVSKEKVERFVKSLMVR
jgi:hypothetical protein